MHLLILLSLCVPQSSAIELGDSFRNEAFDFEIALPKGWTEARAAGSTLFRLQSPPGTLADGAAWISHHDSNHPVTLAFLNDAFRRKAATDWPGYKSITERDITVAGFPGRQIVFSATAKGGKELVFARSVIQRQLQEYFILDIVAAVAEKERVIDLADRMLATFRTGLPAPKDREERVARTAAMLKTSKARLAGTTWHELIVAGKKLGWQRTVLREAKVDGAPGWEFEVESRQEDAEGGKRSDVSSGSFTADGSVQKVEFHRTVRTPTAEPVDVRESVSLVRGVCTATRRFLDQKVDKEFKVPEGTYLGDVADAMRRLIALAPAGEHAIRVLEPFRDLPVVEEWKSAGPARINYEGSDEELIQALVTFGRLDATEHLYELDGTLRRRKSANGIVMLRRCTEEQARKFP